MKKIILIILGLLVSGLFAVSCAPAAEKPKTSGEVMKVAKYYWPGQFWVDIADSKGWFEEAGLNVELVDTNSDYFQSLQDMVDGKIDANNFPVFDLVRYYLQGADLVMVVNADHSSGAEAIVAKQEILSIAGLKGKKIGVDINSYMDYILDVILRRNGMSDKDLIKVEFPVEKLAEEFEKGDLDAAVAWEPFVSELIEKNARKLFDTSEIPGISPNGVVFHKSFIESRPNDVQAFVNVWHKTTEFIKENPGEAFPIIADIYGVTPGEAQAFAQVDRILDWSDNKISFSYAAGFESLHGTARQINNFMIDKGITDRQLDSTEFIDSRFIRGVE
jgi:NitT/TauT family transport system substrate-binding protein